MEKRFSFLEGFSAGAGALPYSTDGFVAAVPGFGGDVAGFTTCTIVRLTNFGYLPEVPGVRVAASNASIAPDTGYVDLLDGLFLTGATADTGGAFLAAVWEPGIDAPDPPTGVIMVLHRVFDPVNDVLFLYGNGLMRDQQPASHEAPVPSGGQLSIGFDFNNLATPFTTAWGVDAAGGADDNGVAGFAYGAFIATPAQVAEHFKQIALAADMVEGPLPWELLLSVRRGLPDLEVAGGAAAVWRDEIGGVVFNRSTLGQEPTLRVSARRGILF